MKDPIWLQHQDIGEDQDWPTMAIDVPSLRSISISVCGKRVFHVTLTQEQMASGEVIPEEKMKEIEPIVMKHGRHAVMTFKLRDGTKQRYRGNGGIIHGPEPQTQLAKKMLTEMMIRDMRLKARQKLAKEML